MPRRYWLMKCEPSAYAIDDLARDGHTSWEGVRNYQARNFMRDDMQVGDGVLFYASNADPSGVTGVAEVVKAGYPDHFAWKKGHKYFDERSAKSARSGSWLISGSSSAFPRSCHWRHSRPSRSGVDDGDQKRQSALGPAGHKKGVRHRRATWSAATAVCVAGRLRRVVVSYGGYRYDEAVGR